MEGAGHVEALEPVPAKAITLGLHTLCRGERGAAQAVEIRERGAQGRNGQTLGSRLQHKPPPAGGTCVHDLRDGRVEEKVAQLRVAGICLAHQIEHLGADDATALPAGTGQETRKLGTG